MGNSNELCAGQCKRPADLKGSNVSLDKSAVIELIDNMPHVKGKFNFTKQASFNKIQRAASQYCENNRIDGVHIPIVARLIAYQQNHYFDAINQLPVPSRQKFVANQEQIDIELMDSLYHYFVVKQKGNNGPELFLGSGKINQPPIIDIAQLRKEHLNELAEEGLNLLRTGAVCIVLMMAGHAENSEPTSKAFGRMKLPDNPIVLQLLMRRLAGYMNGSENTQSSLKLKRRKIPIIIIVASQTNLIRVDKVLAKNNYFGLMAQYVKIIIEDRTVPLISTQGKLCLSAEGKTLGNPAGTAMAVNSIMEPFMKEFINKCNVEYVHFIGCENIAELPGDPVLVGLTHKFQRQVAGKCVSGGNIFSHYPRYLATQSAFHLLDYKEVVALGSPSLIQNAPIALNSLLFRWYSLKEFHHNFETNLYIAKRFHMEERAVNHYDFQRQKPILWAKVFSFQQDIRDYISASTQAIVVRYWPEHFQPIGSPPRELDKISQNFSQPPLY